MKKLTRILLMVFLLLTSVAKAQITFDTTVHALNGFGLGFDFKTVQISQSETKYFVADTSANTFNLYNMDWTPFMTNISVPIPFNINNLMYYQCLYITRTLFDCDSSNIEYLYETPSPGLESKLYIVRTDGTQLFMLDSAFCEYCYGGCMGGSDWVKPIVNTSAGTKLFVLRTFATYDINIYSLCGTLPESTFDFTNSNQSLVKIFPNPTSGTLTFQINPPDNMNDYELVIIDNNAKEAKREKINSGSNKYVIDVSDFSSGTYFYSLCTKNKAYQSGKFVLNK